MVQHYFIGFKVPEREAKQLDEIRKTWNLQETHKVIPHVNDLHVTLLYLGAMEDEVLQKLSVGLERIQDTVGSFHLTLTGVSSFGSPKNPRVLYVSIADEPKLKQLQKNIKTIGESLRLKLDQKPYVPHITLAKKWIGNDDLNLNDMQIEPINIAINQFAIYSIHPQKTPSYQAVKTIELNI